MSKRVGITLVALLATMVSACDMSGSDEKPKQRDVYKSMEDCVADWGDTELCQQQQAEAHRHQEAMAAAAAQSGGHVPAFIFFGPSYVGDRSIIHNGQAITPTKTTALRTASQTVMPGGAIKTSYAPPRPAITPSSLPKTSISSPPALASKPSVSTSSTTARGGFGSTGSAASSSSGG